MSFDDPPPSDQPLPIGAIYKVNSHYKYEITQYVLYAWSEFTLQPLFAWNEEIDTLINHSKTEIESWTFGEFSKSNGSLTMKQLEKHVKTKMNDLKYYCWKSVAEIFFNTQKKSCATEEDEQQETTMLLGTATSPESANMRISSDSMNLHSTVSEHPVQKRENCNTHVASIPPTYKGEKNTEPCDLTSEPTSTELEKTLCAQTNSKPISPLCTSTPKTVQEPEIQGENSVSVTSCPSPPSDFTLHKCGKKDEPEMFKHICDLIRYVAPNSVYNRDRKSVV